MPLRFKGDAPVKKKRKHREVTEETADADQGDAFEGWIYTFTALHAHGPRASTLRVLGTVINT